MSLQIFLNFPRNRSGWQIKSVRRIERFGWKVFEKQSTVLFQAQGSEVFFGSRGGRRFIKYCWLDEGEPAFLAGYSIGCRLRNPIPAYGLTTSLIDLMRRHQVLMKGALDTLPK